MNDDPIAQTLDLAPLTQIPVQQFNSGQMDDDFEYARGNLIAVIEKGHAPLYPQLFAK